MAAFVNGHEDVVHEKEKARAARELKEEEAEKNKPGAQGNSRDGSPLAFEGLEERRRFGPGCRQTQDSTLYQCELSKEF